MGDPPLDPFDLARFVAAQAGAGGMAGHETTLAEVQAGRKCSHWMWYIFPQIAGLGSSPMAARFAIGSLAEARAFLAHPLLGPRYREMVAALQALPGRRTAVSVFGPVDALKLRSSLTLFGMAGAEIDAALSRWCDGADPRTLERLSAARAKGD